jgi:hypothetical protein
MKHFNLFILASIAILLAACTPAAKTISITNQGGKCSLDAGSKISAGEVSVMFTNKDPAPPINVLSFLTLKEGKGYQDLVDLKWTPDIDFPPAWSVWQGDMGADPNSQNEKTFLFKEGPLFVVCISGEQTISTKEHPVTSYGVLGPIQVVK